MKGLSNQVTLEVGLPYVSKKILRKTLGTVFVIPQKKMLIPWTLCVSEFVTERTETEFLEITLTAFTSNLTASKSKSLPLQTL
jgi:hypothetical protein